MITETAIIDIYLRVLTAKGKTFDIDSKELENLRFQCIENGDTIIETTVISHITLLV